MNKLKLIIGITNMNKLKLIIGITLVSVPLLSLECTNQVALAVASGCTAFRFINSKTCINVYGDGLEVGSVKGSFDVGRFQEPICDWRYVIAFIPNDGNKISTASGPVHNSCDKEGSYTKDYIAEYRQPYVAKPGQVCARLYIYKTQYVDAACEYITP
jgi:hypothetical protein